MSYNNGVAVMRIVCCALFLFVCLYGTADHTSAQTMPEPVLHKGRDNIPEWRSDTMYHTPENVREFVMQYPDSLVRILRYNLSLSRCMGFTYGVVHSLMNLGVAYAYTGRHEQAQQYFRQALAHNISNGKSLVPPFIIHNTIVYTYNNAGHYEQAIKHYNKALAAGELHTSPQSIASAHLNIASLLIDLEYTQQAAHYINEAEKIIGTLQDRGLTLSLLNIKGAYYATRKEWDSSMAYFHWYLDSAKADESKAHISTGLHNIASVYIMQGKPEQAMQYLTESRQYYAQQQVGHQIGFSALLGETWMRQGKFGHAEKILKHALQQATELKLDRNLVALHGNLFELYDSIKNYRQAYHHLYMYKQMSDSVSGAMREGVINQLEVKYRVAEKDRAISLQQAEIQKKNFLIIGAFGGALLLVLLIAYLFSLYRNNRHRQALQQKQINILEQNRDIELLKAMFTGEEKERNRIARELHDSIAGQLAAIRMHFNVAQKQYGGLAESADFRLALRQLDDTAAEIRHTAHNLMPDILLEKGLAMAVQLYCEKMGRSKTPVITFQLYSPLPRLNTQLELSLYRMVQELLQNTIKHAQATEAIVQMGYHDHLLSITVEDNGSGMKDAVYEGTGITHIRASMDAMGGHFDIQGTETGTTAYIEIDIQNGNAGFSAKFV